MGALRNAAPGLRPAGYQRLITERVNGFAIIAFGVARALETADDRDWLVIGKDGTAVPIVQQQA